MMKGSRDIRRRQILNLGGEINGGAFFVALFSELSATVWRVGETFKRFWETFLSPPRISPKFLQKNIRAVAINQQRLSSPPKKYSQAYNSKNVFFSSRLPFNSLAFFPRINQSHTTDKKGKTREFLLGRGGGKQKGFFPLPSAEGRN